MPDIPHLETLESQILQFLQSAQRPLVSIRNLLRHMNGIEEFATLEEERLIEFIDAHELFAFTSPPEGGPDFIEPAVYLTTRVPTDLEMKAHMAVELDSMMKALELAHREASENAETERAQQIAALLDRAQQLRKTLADS